MDATTPTKLTAWLRARGLSYSAFAIVIGVSDVTARRIALGIRQADAAVAERIVVATGGEVTVLDLHEARLAFERALGAAQSGEDDVRGAAE